MKKIVNFKKIDFIELLLVKNYQKLKIVKSNIFIIVI